MVKWLAGERVTAGKLSRTILQADCDTTTVLTATSVLMPGMSLTFTCTRDDVQVLASWDLHFQAVGADPLTGAGIGRIRIDGVLIGNPAAIWSAGTNSTTADDMRAQASQKYPFTLDQGSHTIEIYAARSGGTAGDLQVNLSDSTMTLDIEDNV